MRKPIIAGNWKMNMTPSEAKTLIEGILPLVKDNTTTEVVVCPPAITIPAVKEYIKGAFTGETSPVMLN